MIIRELDIKPCTMRKDDPTWRFALAASPVSEGHVVRIATDDGYEGFGYASATPHMGATQGSLKAELELFRPLVIGQDARRIEAILVALDRAVHGAPQAKAAVDCALHDLNARTLGVPLVALFGGPVREAVPILRILAIKSPQDMAAQAQKLVDRGYRYLKIKVHGDVADDVARVAAIRRQVGEDVHLTIDANQSYAVKDAIAALNRMAEYRIDLVEQPVNRADTAGLALVTKSVAVTVEADEAAGSLGEIFELVAQRAVDAVSLKIPKLGGLRNTLAAARLCEAAHIRHRLGAAVGSRLLAAGALHLACALRGVDYACELGEFDRLLDDPFEGIEVENGMLRLPDGAGSGVQLRSRDVTKGRRITRIYVPSQGPDSWRGLLADPKRHWQTGRSAKTLAYCWESSEAKLPAEIATMFEQHGANPELLLALPEHKVPLPGSSRGESQSDVFAIIRAGHQTFAATIEGKVDEPFGSRVCEWLQDASPGKRERLTFICEMLGLAEPLPDDIYYQLLHRTAAAMIEAKRFKTNAACMIVHSFSPSAKWYEAFERFACLLGVRAERSSLLSVPGRSPPLYVGWAVGDAQFLAA